MMNELRAQIKIESENDTFKKRIPKSLLDALKKLN